MGTTETSYSTVLRSNINFVRERLCAVTLIIVCVPSSSRGGFKSQIQSQSSQTLQINTESNLIPKVEERVPYYRQHEGAASFSEEVGAKRDWRRRMVCPWNQGRPVSSMKDVTFTCHNLVP